MWACAYHAIQFQPKVFILIQALDMQVQIVLIVVLLEFQMWQVIQTAWIQLTMHWDSLEDGRCGYVSLGANKCRCVDGFREGFFCCLFWLNELAQLLESKKNTGLGHLFKLHR